MGTIVVPKTLCCKFSKQSLQILDLTCNNEMFARLHETLKFEDLAWFQSVVKNSPFDALKPSQIFKRQSLVKSCKHFIISCEI